MTVYSKEPILEELMQRRVYDDLQAWIARYRLFKQKMETSPRSQQYSQGINTWVAAYAEVCFRYRWVAAAAGVQVASLYLGIRDTRRAVMDTTLVKDLSPRGFQWKTIVCVARIWEHRDQATWQNLFEVDFIVIDQEGNKMEGCIPANRIDQFRYKIN